jgi:hypothetical protein
LNCVVHSIYLSQTSSQILEGPGSNSQSDSWSLIKDNLLHLHVLIRNTSDRLSNKVHTSRFPVVLALKYLYCVLILNKTLIDRDANVNSHFLLATGILK